MCRPGRAFGERFEPGGMAGAQQHVRSECAERLLVWGAPETEPGDAQRGVVLAGGLAEGFGVVKVAGPNGLTEGCEKWPRTGSGLWWILIV